jgi:quercetin dioxygenase-like cupin family protein
LSRPPASIALQCSEFDAALDLLRGAGLRLDVIYPADKPHTAILSHDGETIRLTSEPEATLPGGPVVFQPEFVLTRGGETGGEGRAGMLYRDLIPSRLGGAYIASHINIPEGGPVADWVHFHKVSFQLIMVHRGWVRVVYEDQGEPFVMQAGDMVLQPPEIRHRVLESSPGLEVIEIGAPALHETFADHDMRLPNGREPKRDFAGQRLLRHIAAETPWTPFHGGEAQETEMVAATGGLAEVRTVRTGAGPAVEFPPHNGELAFGFVLRGSAELERGERLALGPTDAFVIPPGQAWRLSGLSPDFRLLHVTTGKIT